MMRARIGIDKNKSWADWAEEEEEEEVATLIVTPEDAKADVKPKCEPTLQLGMRLRGGGSEGGGELGHASGEESGDEGDGGEESGGEESGGEGGEESGEEGSEPDESGSDADDTVDPNRILPKGTRRSRQEPDRFRHEDQARLMLADVPADERAAALDDDDVDEDEGEEEDEEEEGEEEPTEEDRAFIAEDDDGDGEDSAYESREDDSSQSEDESDEESQVASVTSADNEARCETSGRDEAEALLGMPLTSLKIMRLEAQRARDVVDGKKTLELTGRSCHERGVVLIGETADGAIAKGSVIGAVTLGECASMGREGYEATVDRHHALDFAPAKAWLDKGTLYAQVRAPQPHAPRDSTLTPHGTPPSRPTGPDPHSPRRS